MTEYASGGYEQQIHAVRPEAEDIRRLGQGDVNSVFLVDGAETFRFPVSDEGMRTLHYETEILQRLAGRVTLEIPRVIDYVDSKYAVSTFVAGNVLRNHQIAAFSEEQKTGLGQDVANFMQEINAAMTVDQVTALRQQYDPDFEDDPRYYSHVLEAAQKQNHPLLANYAAYYQKLYAVLPEARPIVTHGDLHAGNLVFTGDNALQGVIDFGDFGPGTVYNELRIIYGLGEDIVKATIDALDGAFDRVDIDTVRLYAILHELSVMVRTKPPSPIENERKKVASMLLGQWLGENWDNEL